jgi:protein transport protein SEC13
LGEGCSLGSKPWPSKVYHCQRVTDGTVVIWTEAKEGEQWEGRILHDFKRLSWSLTGNILAVSDGNNSVTLWKEAVDGEWQQVTTVEP